MASACRCYAFGEDTASVFYSMGVLQKGLEALAKHLNVSFPAPLEAQQWQTIIDKLDAEIAQRTKMAAQQTQSSAKRRRTQILRKYLLAVPIFQGCVAQ
jgi:hypothetical protein